jgi:hypothetical protein
MSTATALRGHESTAAACLRQVTANFERRIRSFEIHVFPLEGQELALPQAGSDGQYIEGLHTVEVEDLDFAYALYAGDPTNGSATRVASFREGRIGYRLWATKSDRINPSLEDRLDHDVDELMG